MPPAAPDRLVESQGERRLEVVLGVGAERDVCLGREHTVDLVDPVGDDVASVVADRLNKVTGVTETETHIAFRAYSQHDLEAAFSLGLD